MNVFIGQVREVKELPDGRQVVVSVRGARVDVAADLVPEARIGDSVLVHAGVALSVLQEQEETPCA